MIALNYSLANNIENFIINNLVLKKYLFIQNYKHYFKKKLLKFFKKKL